MNKAYRKIKEFKAQVQTFLDSNDFPKITLTDDDVTQHVLSKDNHIIEKSKEKIYRRDGNNMSRRMDTGRYGEIGVEKYLGIKFVNYTVGHTKDYSVPDLRPAGYEVGVKSSQWNDKYCNSALIPRNIKTPQIITLITGPMEVTIVGFGTPEELRNNLDIDLVLSPSARRFKSGLSHNGYRILKPFKNLDQFKEIYNVYNM